MTRITEFYTWVALLDQVGYTAALGMLWHAVPNLTPREQRVMELRAGADHRGRRQALAEVADELRVTRERVLQLEKSALRKFAATGRLLVREECGE